jgi:hypothetical protein
MASSRFAHRRFLVMLAALACIWSALITPAYAEWNEKVLYSFQGGSDGDLPRGEIVRDAAGNLYGVTQLGGAENCSPMAYCGTVYEVSPPVQEGDPWTEKVLYVCKGKAENDGEYPNGGLVMDAAGNLYGTAFYGGTGDCVLFGIKGGCGVVFELSPPVHKGGTWKETVLYSFKGGNDGYVPAGDLTFDKSGNLYGVTLFGGGKGSGLCDPFYQGCGTVFKLSAPKTKSGKWTEQVLYSFAAGTDGYYPNGGLLIDSVGNLYGTTPIGGNEKCNYGDERVGCGTLYRLRPSDTKGGQWVERILHRFLDGDDGASPNGGLIADSTGSIYGTALGGGSSKHFGVVFEMAEQDGKWDLETLYNFQGESDGENPLGPLTFDIEGNLYGTASITATGYGDVFQIKLPSRMENGSSWSFSILYNFTGSPDGSYPAARLSPDGRGNLYSTTEGGGIGNCYGEGPCGTVFEVSP